MEFNLSRGVGMVSHFGHLDGDGMIRLVMVLTHDPRAALARACRGVDPNCDLAMTATAGIVALVLPVDLRWRPDTAKIELRLAAIARDFENPQETAEPTP